MYFNELVAAGESVLDLKSAPAVAIAILIVPLYDTLRVTFLRLRDRKSIFIGDKRHLHHMMLRAGLSHRQATLSLSLFNIFVIGIALLLDNIGILMLGLVLLAICLAATGILNVIVRKRVSAPPKMVKVPDIAEMTTLN